MEMIECFIAEYFNVDARYFELDKAINKFQRIEKNIYKKQLILELEVIINNCNYQLLIDCILKLGERKFSKRMSEEFIRYLYARLKNKKPRLTLEQLFKIR
jgi:hypothetical protein